MLGLVAFEDIADDGDIVGRVGKHSLRPGTSEQGVIARAYSIGRLRLLRYQMDMASE